MTSSMKVSVEVSALNLSADAGSLDLGMWIT